MSHAVDDHQLGSLDGLRGGSSTAHVHQRIVRTVEHERRDAQRPQSRGAVGRGDHREHLACDALRVVRAIVGQSGPRAQLVLVELEAR